MSKKNMTDEERRARNEYMKEWYSKNKSRICEKNRQKYRENIDERRTQQREYYNKNSDRIKEWQRQYRRDNQDVVRKTDHDKYMRNRDAILAKETIKYQLNPTKKREQAKEYRVKHSHDIAICAVCKKEFVKEKFKDYLCSSCIKLRKEALHSYDSTYKRNWKNGENLIDHREVLKEAGLLTPEIEKEGYIVHHLDGVKDNKNVDNLLLIKPQDHARLHRILESEWVKHPDMSMEELTEIIIHKCNMDFI